MSPGIGSYRAWAQMSVGSVQTGMPVAGPAASAGLAVTGGIPGGATATRSSLALGPTLRGSLVLHKAPAVVTPGARALGAHAAGRLVLPGASPVNSPAARAEAIRFPAPGSRDSSVEGFRASWRTLRGMESGFRAGQKGAAAPAAQKAKHDGTWDRAAVRPDATDAPPVSANGTLANSPARRGLRPSSKARPGLSGLVAAVPLAALPVKLPMDTIRHWLQLLQTGFATMPQWAQTSAWVAGGFTAAWIFPKVVSKTVKWVFRWVDWDPLREAFVVNVASGAAWATAVGFAMYQVGGLQALALNGTAFTLATTLAVKDLASKLMAGLSLYKDRPFEIGDEIEAAGEKGIVADLNARFVILDTSQNPKADYERVLIPNDLMLDAITTGAKKAGWAALAALAFLPALSAPWAPPLVFAGKLLGTLALSVLLGNFFKSRAVGAKKRAKEARPDPEKFRKLSKRATLLRWAGNAAYLGGLWMILNMFGVTVTGLVGSMSIISAAIGFWTKDLASNLVAGLMVAAYRPFTKGDYIEVGKEKGVVEDITQRFILLRLDDGRTRHVALTSLTQNKIRIGKKTPPPSEK
ncbi:MAG: mechanosensitive ion channel domain-containing protein [Elusimicrobiota bacterium]